MKLMTLAAAASVAHFRSSHYRGNLTQMVIDPNSPRPQINGPQKCFKH
ncbi:hypothetical protein FE844_020840 [Rhizobium indicum]|nr:MULTISPECIES: hypothetical protein [Rhizobium]MBA1346002.1 hypothetical protein [Rhizobium sp. WYCCWR 11146]QKK31878.1 hypothetical protein FE844_020840 [Rhizobium indicum]